MSSQMLAHVISIWPEDLHAGRHLFQPASDYNRSNQFFLSKAVGDEPQILNVGAFKQREKISDRWVEQMVSAEDVARDIVREWADNRDDRVLGKPGVFVWEGPDNPTIEQIKASDQYKHYLRLQRTFANEQVEKARDFHKNDQPREITNLMFLCAEYLRIENEEWQARKLTDSAARMACPVCTKAINVSSMKCPHCQEIVNAKAYKAYRDGVTRALAGGDPQPAQSAAAPATQNPGQQPQIKRQ